MADTDSSIITRLPIIIPTACQEFVLCIGVRNGRRERRKVKEFLVGRMEFRTKVKF